MERPAPKPNGASPRRRILWTRLQSDERLVASVRRGNEAAFAELVRRYRPWLLATCRQLVRSREDAEDLLQEVFASAFKAMLADERPINVRPWLFRITRNRSLNHLRRARSIPSDDVEELFPIGVASAADTVQGREELRLLVGDINELPAAQRSALVLREVGALSYEQIAETMEKSVPSVKSLLVRARRSLTAASEARERAYDEAHGNLGGRTWRAAALPVALLRKLGLPHLGHSGGAGATAAGAGAAAPALIASSSTGSLVSAGIGAIAAKTAAGLAAAALVTAGAVAVDNDGGSARHSSRPSVTAAPSQSAVLLAQTDQPPPSRPLDDTRRARRASPAEVPATTAAPPSGLGSPAAPPPTRSTAAPKAASGTTVTTVPTPAAAQDRRTPADSTTTTTVSPQPAPEPTTTSTDPGTTTVSQTTSTTATETSTSTDATTTTDTTDTTTATDTSTATDTTATTSSAPGSP